MMPEFRIKNKKAAQDAANIQSGWVEQITD